MGWKLTGGVIAGFIITAIVIVGIAVAVYFIKYYTAEPLGKLEAKQIVESGQYRIQEYQWFYNTCNQIIAYEEQLQDQYGKMELLSDEDVQVKETIRTMDDILAIKAQRSRLIQKYNSKAEQRYTAGQFVADDLPVQIEDFEVTKDNKRRTECECMEFNCGNGEPVWGWD